MSDLDCPYCDAPQRVDHDDGHGYAEDRKHEQGCRDCGKAFTFTTSIMYHYEPAKADCLNDGEHQWAMTSTHPLRYTKWRCNDCDAEKALSEIEMQQLLAKDQP